MGNTVYNIHAKASLPCVHLPVIAIAGGKGVTYWPDDVPEAIRKSCVLWYDPARQGCTNEGMAANPVLKDLSGNGHYARCYNFAWSGMSGIGGYVQSNFNIRANNSSIFDVSVQGNIVTYQKNNGTVIEANGLILYDSGNNWNRDIETKVKAGKYGLNVYVTEGMGVNPKNILSLPPYEIGSFTYAQSDYDDGKNTIMFGNTIEVPVGEVSSFEFLPQYPNALVSDGMNDYAQVTGLPLLTKERGYTVIAKRELLSEGLMCLSSKRKTTEQNGAFVFELKMTNSAEGPIVYRADSFGEPNNIAGLEKSVISWQTSKSYNGTSIIEGSQQDNDVLSIFNLFSNYYCAAALYSFILFDRDLASDEIDWVKTNILGEANQ